ncbi:SPX domain containing protein [Acanthamoeba castellanii str. Neff]|uniref:SPX domain containing protein n=1 Tax=Acanthamoeba castellanii (strain ATCC 30010 / Neff) TaxID=1257118 RepID=L8GH73_ACACF|nr:SPX domain containing protein [Acanthamoeba castellanii str. Neff]ELR12179.1 SPX domain containing protein [Acanthamoeba castellanii str. Neff]
MTFEKQLQFHAVTTWRRKYIAYGEVKKILKRIEQLLRDERVGQTAAGGLEEDGATSDEEGYVGHHHHHHHEGEGLLVGKHRAAEVEEALEELELTFFRRLRDEQAKVDGFYHQQLQYLLTRSERLNDQLRSFEAASELSPADLHKASKRLEKAVVDFYRHLMLLDNYALFNFTAFQKLLMKHDRITQLSSAEYLELIEHTSFVARTTLTSLIHDTEEKFRDMFANGSLDKAKAKLLARQHDYFDWKVLQLGFVAGGAACILLALVLLLLQGQVQEVTGPVGWSKVLPVYRLSAMPILGIWLWGVNVLIWHRTRVNHVYIFDLSPTSALSHIHLFRFAGFLSVLWGTSFFLYAGTAAGHFNAGPAEIFPLALTCTLILLIVCPFNILHRSSRVFFLQVLVSVVLAPFGKLRFVDGYLGDLLTSMVKTLGDAEYTVCYYTTGDWLENTGRCQIANRYGAAAMACLPLFWRMMQCLGRYSATKHVEHLGNSTKYLVALSVVLLSQLYGDLSSAGEWSAIRVLWCIAFIVSTLYSYLWDIFMDWGLGRWHSQNFPLRDELFYSNRKWFYYYCIVSNFVFRFFWTITLSGTPIHTGIDSTTMGWIAATVEVVRRFTWSLLRVENEFQSKAGDVSVYRDTDFIPLPFQVNQVEVSDAEHGAWRHTDDDNDEHDGQDEERPHMQPPPRGGMLVNGKGKNTTASTGTTTVGSPLSSYDDDGDLHMLYSINATTHQ